MSGDVSSETYKKPTELRPGQGRDVLIKSLQAIAISSSN